MYVVLPFCGRDIHLALKGLAICKKLDGRQGKHSLVLVHDQTVDSTAILKVASESFEFVRHWVIPVSPYGTQWPRPCNWAWQSAARRALQGSIGHWLWWEPDSVPLKAGWLDQLEAAYREAGKPLGGWIQESKWGKYMVGVGIYPQDIFMKAGTARQCTTSPWDIQLGAIDGFVKHTAHLGPLLTHHYREDGKGDTITSLFEVPEPCVLYHRCDDGSLHDLVLGKGTSTKIDTADEFDWRKCYYQNVAPSQVPETCCIVQLGRIGDILNILPIAKYLRSRSLEIKCPVMVQSKYLPLLSRTNYVIPLEWPGDINDLEQATSKVNGNYSAVLVPQLFSKKGIRDPVASNYNRDHWQHCRVGNFLGDFPLEFNNRSWQSEQRLWDSLELKTGPVIAYNLEGESSPFTRGGEVLELLRSKLHGCNLVDLNAHQVPCFVDQLGILDRADVVLTIDTATLHLVQASPTPYIALLSDREPFPWKSSWLRRKPVASWSYNALELKELADAIESALRSPKPLGRLYHVTKLFPGADTKLSYPSWESLYSNGQLHPRLLWHVNRDATVLGDTRKLPFLFDILAESVRGLSDEDAILYTNADIIVTPMAVRHFRRRLLWADMVAGMRVDVGDWRGEEWAVPRDSYSGRDAFAFRVGWLRKHLEELPDMLVGASEWDLCYLALARSLLSLPTTLQNIECNFPECEVPQAGLIHRFHPPIWNAPKNIDDAPSQIYNRTIGAAWFRAHHPSLRFHWFRA